jgi:hypothetical protein
MHCDAVCLLFSCGARSQIWISGSRAGSKGLPDAIHPLAGLAASPWSRPTSGGLNLVGQAEEGESTGSPSDPGRLRAGEGAAGALGAGLRAGEEAGEEAGEGAKPAGALGAGLRAGEGEEALGAGLRAGEGAAGGGGSGPGLRALGL